MKFTDGRWLLRPGVQAFHPVEVLDAETGPGTLTVHAAVVRVRHRGDLLKGPMVTLTLSAPAPAVIAVNITHLTGGHYMREHLSLGLDTVVYGLGERFGPLVKNGQVVDIWNADGGTGREQ